MDTQNKRARSLDQVVILWRCATCLLLLPIFSTKHARAQVAEGDLIYKFTAQGIHLRAEAKPLQYALMEQPSVSSCDFIEECACFKLSTPQRLDRSALNSWLHASGHQLAGTVEVSDGTFLPPEPAPER